MVSGRGSISLSCFNLLLYFAALLFASTSVAQANCREDPRTIQFDGKNIVRVKSYSCAVADDASARVRVEFYRVADPVAGLIVEGRSSEMLMKVMGSPRIVRNEVSNTYAGLLKDYGEARLFSDGNIETPRADFGFRLESGGKLGSVGHTERFGLHDKATGGPYKVLLPIWNAIVAGGPPTPHSDFYPAIDEISEIRKKMLPDGINIFYNTSCLDPAPESFEKPSVCKRYSDHKMIFWRGMQARDVEKYSANLTNYNSAVGRFRDVGEIESEPSEIPQTLRLLRHLAGEGPWPEDYTVLVGALSLNDCGGLLQFAFLLRTILLDVVLIENDSTRAISLDGLAGSFSKETNLRPISSFLPNQKIALDATARSLDPGQRILIPLKITLAPNDDTEGFFSYPSRAEAIYKRLGTNGYFGKTQHRSPRFKNYEFGRSLTIKGIYVNNKEIDFSQKSANFVDGVLGWGEYSCPYLLSWDDVSQQWINHGKILHKARGEKKEYAEVMIFPGLRTRFQLQEREPEIAYIQKAELAIMLKDKNVIYLQSRHPALGRSCDKYVTLYWGQSVTFEFTMPDALQSEAVEQSRLIVRGYYEPYSTWSVHKTFSTTKAADSKMNYCPRM